MLISILPALAMLYTPPANSFITSPTGSETIIQLQDTSGSISTAQSTLNNARSANPSAILVLNLNASSYSVSSTGLVLSSNECLVLSPSTTITAASGATAGYLIQVASGASNVSISGGTLNGNGQNLNCIQAPDATRLNVSQLTAEDCESNVLQLYGPGQTTMDCEITVADCTISTGTSTYSGISLHTATQAVIVDNTVSGFASGSAIYVKSCGYCTIAENTCTGNSIGISAYGNNLSITDNTCSSNATGILLGANGSSASDNLCTSNTLDDNTTVAIDEAGEGDTICDNSLSGNGATLTLGGSSNNILPRKGALTAGQNYFYPPLIDDQQTGTIVNGKGRYDLTPGSSVTTLSGVQSLYNTAVSDNPGDVIVLHLNYTYTADATLTLDSDTCVLLSGTINLTSGVNGISATNASDVSISGGTINGNGYYNDYAIVLSGCTMAQLDGITVEDFGPTTPRNGEAAVWCTGSHTPLVVTRVNFNEGSARGLWLQDNGYQPIVSRSTFTNFNQDGIDCDSGTATGLFKYNTCTGNVRAGIFVEQSDTYDQVIGNTLDDNTRAGVSLWNNGVDKNESPGTNWNTVACNIIDDNPGIGIECGSQPGSSYEEYVSHNFCFNNEVEDNPGTGQEDTNLGQGENGTANDIENYFSQNLVLGNGTNYALSPNGGENFFDSVTPYEFNPVAMNPVGSGASVSSQSDPNTPFGELEYLNATGTGQTMTLTSPPTIAGTYTVEFGYKAYTARGQCTLTIDGTQVGGTIDEYSSSTRYLLTSLGSVTLSAGQHTIVLKVVGKDSSSTAYTISADEVILVGQ